MVGVCVRVNVCVPVEEGLGVGLQLTPAYVTVIPYVVLGPPWLPPTRMYWNRDVAGKVTEEPRPRKPQPGVSSLEEEAVQPKVRLEPGHPLPTHSCVSNTLMHVVTVSGNPRGLRVWHIGGSARACMQMR